MSAVYSLWLVPDRESLAFQELAALIRDCTTLADDAPVFDPHVTLLGGLSGEREAVVATTEKLAREADSPTVTLTDVSCSTTTHQCVFARVQPTVSLLTLHQEAVERFGVSPPMYVPHLSLLYSEMPIADRVSLADSLALSDDASSFEVAALEVVETSGPVSTWETVARCGFGEGE